MHIRKKKCKEKEKTSQIISQHLIEINMTNEMVKQKSEFQHLTKCIEYNKLSSNCSISTFIKIATRMITFDVEF